MTKLYKLTLLVFQLLYMPTSLVLDPANEPTKSLWKLLQTLSLGYIEYFGILHEIHTAEHLLFIVPSWSLSTEQTQNTFRNSKFSLSQTCLSSLISLVIPLRSTGPIMVIILSGLHKQTWWTNWTAYSLSLAFGSFPNKLSKIICLKQE